VEARGRRPGQKKNGLPARKPMVIKRRRELRRQGQFSCQQCKATHPLANLRKCCGACPKMLRLQRAIRRRTVLPVLALKENRYVSLCRCT